MTHVLKVGGKFVAKIFRGKDTSLLYCQVLVGAGLLVWLGISICTSETFCLIEEVSHQFSCVFSV